MLRASFPTVNFQTGSVQLYPREAETSRGFLYNALPLRNFPQSFQISFSLKIAFILKNASPPRILSSLSPTGNKATGKASTKNSSAQVLCCQMPSGSQCGHVTVVFWPTQENSSGVATFTRNGQWLGKTIPTIPIKNFSLSYKLGIKKITSYIISNLKAPTPLSISEEISQVCLGKLKFKGKH